MMEKKKPINEKKIEQKADPLKKEALMKGEIARTVPGFDWFQKAFPVTVKGNVPPGWRNGAKKWYVHPAPKKPGLYTMDIEFIPDSLARAHNDPGSQDNIATRYRKDLCPHKCPFCFNEENQVYTQMKTDLGGKIVVDKNGNPILNRVMEVNEVVGMIDQAISIARSEGHEFQSVKFLGPGELLTNPRLFEIIEALSDRGVHIGIFTKGALLGSDELAQKYHGMTAKELADKLASYENVSLLFSFQTFEDKMLEGLVTSRDEHGSIIGLKGYPDIRKKALENLFSSKFYKDGVTERLCMLNAPILPETIDEAFAIYKFFIDRGTPIVMTPSMVSGKGKECVQRANESAIGGQNSWFTKLEDLYSKIYAFNISKGIQNLDRIQEEGIASYVGADPCNQVALGLYVRINGIVQMCPGRFDKETVYGNLFEEPLASIWARSPNREMGFKDPHNLVNNRCPAKDGYAFPPGFYDRVMAKLEQLLKAGAKES
jgi:MoaA/NifB/PqqE/SkfB family radical SAM enzyme